MSNFRTGRDRDLNMYIQQQIFTIWIPYKFDTVGIWNPTLSGFWMVKKRLVCKWSGFWMGSEIRKPNHLKTDQNGHHLLFTICNPNFLVRISNGPVFKWLKPDHLKTDFQKGLISDHSRFHMVGLQIPTVWSKFFKSLMWFLYKFSNRFHCDLLDFVHVSF